jgi:hypothetical protein
VGESEVRNDSGNFGGRWFKSEVNWLEVRGYKVSLEIFLSTYETAS